MIWNIINEHNPQEIKEEDILKRKRKRDKVKEVMSTHQKA